MRANEREIGVMCYKSMDWIERVLMMSKDNIPGNVVLVVKQNWVVVSFDRQLI